MAKWTRVAKTGKKSLAGYVQGARESGLSLAMAYQSCPLRGEHARPTEDLTDGAREHVAALAAEFETASPEVRREFVVRILADPMPGDLPLRLNGTPLDLPFPEPDGALAILVSDQAWHQMGDDEEAEEYRLEIQQTLHWIAVRLEELGHDAALVAAFRKLANSLPDVAGLIGLVRVGNAANAAMMATRVHCDLRDGRVDALSQGLALAVAHWADRKRFGEIRGDEIRSLRKQAGLTQAELAEALGITPRHVVRLESGETRASDDLGFRIVEACWARAKSGNAMIGEPV
ncbi:helix-turn-helix transcriptional regulator [Azospirillum soli]|uniref:helix-turn-helix transcriptional regulator n=1 Tax=Azospirillum soli TaxID=1304799 RepID=UPI001AE9A13A|nr:helix-turn-helix transcriptional regulator [Azospirillum soli]MBP2315449.1 DNA-binding XRE family transcriptional regulator [Azospirillum soli]